MRIIFDCRSVFAGMGGIGRTAAALARELPRALPGDEVLLLTGARRPASPLSTAPNAHELPTNAAMLDAAFEQVELPELLEELGADIYHGMTFAVPIAQTRAKRVATIHDVVFRRRPELVEEGLRGYLDRWTEVSCDLADAVVTVSEFSRREIQALYPLSSRVEVIPNAVDDAFFEPPPMHVSGEPYVLYVGAIEAKKNIAPLLRGFAALLRLAPELPHALVLAGGGGGAPFDLARALADEPALAGRVHAPGVVGESELRSLYAQAAALCYLSEYEGFGLPPLEALAAGTPCIVSDRASLPEVTGGAAIVVDPHDADAVARALLEVIRDPCLRALLGKTGRIAARRYAWSKSATRLAALYRELVAPARSAPEVARKKKIRIRSGHACLGDRLCVISAARAFARLHPETEVFLTTTLPKVVEAYGDDLVQLGEEGEERVCEPFGSHRAKERSPLGNYAGTFLAALGVPVEGLPALELPALGPPAGLQPRTYIAFQPLSGTAPNPSPSFVHSLLATARRVAPDWPVVAVGLPDTPKQFAEVDYTHLGGPCTFLQTVAHAAFVLTPRSASAHAAAAYRVPSFVWVPDDGENWHLDYPNCPHQRTRVAAGADLASASLELFLSSVRTGVIGGRKSGGPETSFEAGDRDLARVSCRGVPVLIRTEKHGDIDVIRDVIERDVYGLRALRDAPVQTILDVGAHLGTFSLFAKTVWPHARVIAIEPNPRSCALLRRNLAPYANATIVEAALRHDGADILTDSDGATGGGFVASEETIEPLLHPNGRDRVWRCQPLARVRTLTLDEALRGVDRVDLAKFDCEGSEHDIFSRASEAALRKLRWIVGEFHDERGPGPFARLLRERLPTHEVTVEPEVAIGLFRATPRGGGA
jgi:FkbM family methyltransferase